MDNHTKDFAPVSEHAADWHQEAAYHIARAAQEQKLAARSTVPEAEMAHAALAQCHLARAGIAKHVSQATDAGPVRVGQPSLDEDEMGTPSDSA